MHYGKLRAYIFLAVSFLVLFLTPSQGTADTNSMTNAVRVESPSPPHSTDEQTHLGLQVFVTLYVIVGLGIIIAFATRQMKSGQNAMISSGDDTNLKNVRMANLFFLPMFHLVLSSVLLCFCFPKIGTALLWSAAWFSAGVLLGFIFGIPKVARQG